MSVDGDGPVLQPESGPGPRSDRGGDLRRSVAAMSELARTLHDRRGSVTDMLEVISSAAVTNVPEADSAGVSALTDRGRLERRASTDELSERVADLQNEAGEGPCLQSLRDRRPVLVADMATDARWPRFTARVSGERVGSMLSAPLFVGDVGLGSLSLYADTPNAFGDRAQELLTILASHASVALAGAQTEEGLRMALDNRDLIGQAKGILMERHKVTGQEAFMMLVTVSQTRNVKLRDVAAYLATTGSLG